MAKPALPVGGNKTGAYTLARVNRSLVDGALGGARAAGKHVAAAHWRVGTITCPGATAAVSALLVAWCADVTLENTARRQQYDHVHVPERDSNLVGRAGRHTRAVLKGKLVADRALGWAGASALCPRSTFIAARETLCATEETPRTALALWQCAIGSGAQDFVGTTLRYAVAVDAEGTPARIALRRLGATATQACRTRRMARVAEPRALCTQGRIASRAVLNARARLGDDKIGARHALARAGTTAATVAEGVTGGAL